MARAVHNDVLDALLNEIAEANLAVLCSAQPTTRAEAVTTYALADVTITAGTAGDDWEIGDGDTDGRKLTFTEQNGVLVDASGTATHLAFVDGTRLLAVTTTASVALTSGNTTTILSCDFVVRDPTAP